MAFKDSTKGGLDESRLLAHTSGIPMDSRKFGIASRKDTCCLRRTGYRDRKVGRHVAGLLAMTMQSSAALAEYTRPWKLVTLSLGIA